MLWATHFLSACISTVRNRRCTVSVQAVKQDHMVSEGYRQIWSAMLHVPTHSVSLVSRLYTHSEWVCSYGYISFCSFKWFFSKKKSKKKIAYLRWRKRSILSTTSIDQHLQHIKLNPGVQTGLSSKLLRHSSFPSKPLVTICVCVWSCKNSKLLLTVWKKTLSPIMAAF